MNCRCRDVDEQLPVKDAHDVKSGFVVRSCVVLFRGYQYFISPLFPPSCRFTPTCSQYAIEAVQRYGVFRGLFLALRRILRCHPFGGDGYDPVK